MGKENPPARGKGMNQKGWFGLIVTARQMKGIEGKCLKYSLSMERLMENAGSAAAAAIRRIYTTEGKFVTIFCGRGNNGGDGFVVARKLAEGQANVVVVLTDGQPRTEQAQEMLTRITYMEIPVVEYGSDPDYLTERLAQTDLLVDAIYGSGFHGELDDYHRDICRLMNGVGAPVAALDIPSGLTADTGAADPYAIQAQYTIAFDSEKPADVLPFAARYCGKVITADIGIPPEAHEGVEEHFTVMDSEYVFSRLKKRPRETHKGNYGHLLVVGGCRRYMGAAVLSVLAAMRTGTGYVTLASTKEVCSTALPLLPEAVMLPLGQTREGQIAKEGLNDILDAVQRSTAVLIGNGLGPEQYPLVSAVLQDAHCPVIIDADGINALSQNISILKRAEPSIGLTPHIKEFSRLTDRTPTQIKQDPVTESLAFAKEYGVSVALKDAYTVTASASGHLWINTTGNAGMAKAGSGDVLAGIAGSLAAQGYPVAEALACGVWLHGLAGDYAARNRSQYGMLARDIIDSLCAVFSDYDR